MVRYAILLVVVLHFFGVACGSLITPSTQLPQVDSATPITMAATKSPDAGSVTTATLPSPPLLPEDPRPRDLRVYLDGWPEERKLVIERDLIVTFTYSHPAVTWDQTASLHHVPSMSRVDLNSVGKVAITQYGNKEGRQALERLLTDHSLMKLIHGLISWE